MYFYNSIWSFFYELEPLNEFFELSLYVFPNESLWRVFISEDAEELLRPRRSASRAKLCDVEWYYWLNPYSVGKGLAEWHKCGNKCTEKGSRKYDLCPDGACMCRWTCSGCPMQPSYTGSCSRELSYYTELTIEHDIFDEDSDWLVSITF